MATTLGDVTLMLGGKVLLKVQGNTTVADLLDQLDKACKDGRIIDPDGFDALAHQTQNLPAGEYAVELPIAEPAQGQRAFYAHTANLDEDIHSVEAKTNDTPPRCVKVPRNRQGKLFVDAINKHFANRGQVLLGIDDDDDDDVLAADKEGVRLKQAVAYPTQQTFLKQLWQAIVA